MSELYCTTTGISHNRVETLDCEPLSEYDFATAPQLTTTHCKAHHDTTQHDMHNNKLPALNLEVFRTGELEEPEQQKKTIDLSRTLGMFGI